MDAKTLLIVFLSIISPLVYIFTRYIFRSVKLRESQKILFDPKESPLHSIDEQYHIGGTKKINIPKKDDVSLALSTPKSVAPSQKLVIRFSAYLEQNEEKFKALLSDLNPEYKNIMNMDHCKWKRGTKISVRLYSDYLKTEEELQKFEWTGKDKILNFDCIVLDNAPLEKYIDIKVDVLITGIVIARLRSSLKVDSEASENEQIIKTKPYKTAFASYAREDSNIVVGRLSEIERNGIEIFWDRFSLQYGERWKDKLETGIKNSQMFILFWSSHAKKSEWVEWEWRTALKLKGIDGIEPHPLESPEEAEPPDELKPLHFDDKYLSFRRQKK